MTLNYLCKHDISEDDCYKCIKHGIVFKCPKACPDFEDVRNEMSKEMLEARSKLMKMLGVTDSFEVGEPNT